MSKALLLAPMGSVHRRFNAANIQALQALGYEVHLAANFADGDGPEKQNREFARDCADRKIVIHSIAFRRRSLLKSLACLGEVRALIRNGHYAIVHAHTETGGLILRLAGKPDSAAKYFYTAHGMSFYRGSSWLSQLVYRPIERWICSGMDANIAINGEELAVLKQWNETSAALIHGIGLDLERLACRQGNRAKIRKELGIPEAAAVVLSIGELDKNKNHRTVVEALAELHFHHVYYVICGIGPERDALGKLAAMLGIRDRVILAGYRRDIPDMIQAADLFAFPSYHEGLAVSLLEAVAGGLPVVCSKIRGNVDLIEDGINGYLVEPDDVVLWQDRLNRLIADKALCERFAENGRAGVTRYSMESVKYELTALYRGGK